LRIERHRQQAIAAARDQRLDPRPDRRVAVAHRPIDLDVVVLGTLLASFSDWARVMVFSGDSLFALFQIFR